MKTRFRDVCNTHTPYKLSELHESSFPIRPYCNAIMSVFVREWVLFSFVPAWALLHRCSPIHTHTYIEPRAEQRKLVSDTSVTPLITHPILIMSVFVREWVLFSFVPAWALLHRCSPIDTHIHRGAQQRPAGNGIVRYNTLTTKSIQSHKSTAYAYTR